MTRSRFLLLFGASAGTASAVDRTPAEAAEDAEICRVASQVMEAYASADFVAVARAMHSTALKLVFDSICTGFEQLTERFGEERVLAVSGLSDHPRKLGLSHSAFFAHCFDLLASKHPGITAIPPERELKIIGGIVDPQGHLTYAHILYDYRGEMKSDASETPFVQPKNLTLIQMGIGWQCWSAIGGTQALSKWYSELAPKKS
jgi:hypothetical protein